MAVEPAVPGWYADPRGESRYRYWNGEAWTGLAAASLWEVQRINEAQAVTPSPEWARSSPRRKQGDWFDALLPWLVADEETGKTPAGQLLFFVCWVALTIFLLSGGC